MAEQRVGRNEKTGQKIPAWLIASSPRYDLWAS
jgi:hypothetical protein